jgi:hypothetical protein
VQAEQCLYLNSHTCAREGKMPCLPTTCYHELEAADPCRPPTFKLDDVDCNDFDDLDQCLLFSGRVEWPWMQTACTMVLSFSVDPPRWVIDARRSLGDAKSSHLRSLVLVAPKSGCSRHRWCSTPSPFP